MNILRSLQARLNFEPVQHWPHFEVDGLGRVSIAALGIGLIAGFHLCLGLLLLFFSHLALFGQYTQLVVIWSLYVVCVAGFHALEFLSTLFFQPSKLSYDSFVINHSLSYTAALLGSIVEYWIEALLFPSWKISFTLLSTGIFLVIAGQIIRTWAMYECGENFSHMIAHEKATTHELVTTGIYRYLRHPAYFGWFYWSIGSQCMLCNPICLCGYVYASWTFMKERILYEEALMIKFFGRRYIDYMNSSFIGIPFITGATNYAREMHTHDE